ncbi:hypothetical protein Taro_028559 [Colocasia esculenta]|uniref:Uncharacterized protein n=1 Tax=Colocasia esculenta TaxID=4460 RepID=A0A843VUI9_COLES|nr:hypothetical protein [Colocasia esculenta]
MCSHLLGSHFSRFPVLHRHWGSTEARGRSGSGGGAAAAARGGASPARTSGGEGRRISSDLQRRSGGEAIHGLEDLYFVLRGKNHPNMDKIPGIFSYRDEAFVIHLYRGIGLDVVVSDVCNRWKLCIDKVEFRCVVPELTSSKMRITNGEDIDRMVDMHISLGAKVMNVEVIIHGEEELISTRLSSVHSSGSNSQLSTLEGMSSQEGRRRADLCCLCRAATALNGENELFPLAYAVVDVENESESDEDHNTHEDGDEQVQE